MKLTPQGRAGRAPIGAGQCGARCKAEVADSAEVAADPKENSVAKGARPRQIGARCIWHNLRKKEQLDSLELWCSEGSGTDDDLLDLKGGQSQVRRGLGCNTGSQKSHVRHKTFYWPLFLLRPEDPRHGTSPKLASLAFFVEPYVIAQAKAIKGHLYVYAAEETHHLPRVVFEHRSLGVASDCHGKDLNNKR